MFSPKEYAQFIIEETEVIQLDRVLWNNSNYLNSIQPLTKLRINVEEKNPSLEEKHKP